MIAWKIDEWRNTANYFRMMDKLPASLRLVSFVLKASAAGVGVGFVLGRRDVFVASSVALALGYVAMLALCWHRSTDQAAEQFGGRFFAFFVVLFLMNVAGVAVLAVVLLLLALFGVVSGAFVGLAIAKVVPCIFAAAAFAILKASSRVPLRQGVG